MDFTKQLKVPVGFDALYGQKVTELTPELGVCEVMVGPEHLQPTGLVHGGVYAAIAESIASLATNSHTLKHGQIGVGLSNQTSFMRPIKSGSIHGVAKRIHAGRSTWVWDVEMRDDAGRLAAISRMTIAVRPIEAQAAETPQTGATEAPIFTAKSGSGQS